MKYTEEEKKAIENLNEILTHKNDVDIAYGYNIERPYPIGREKIAQLEIIKNLLEKQQKEIETLKQENEYLNCVCESDAENYVPKEAIREKIKEIETETESYYKNGYYDTGAKMILEELLGE